MSRVFLVRHGQAGTRKAYDSLSELGRKQARQLGEYFLEEGVRFDAVYRGEMTRQAMTTDEVRSVYDAAGAAFPEPVVDAGWNEFDLDHIYKALAPRLCADDAEFRAQYAEMAAAARAAEDAPDAQVNRKWMPCDTTVVRAWITERYAYDGESWSAFRARVAQARERMPATSQETNIAIFTSATPIGVWTALAMEIEDHRAMKLAGVMHNTGFSVIRLHGDEMRLHAFNAVPHLRAPEMRTHR